jgi:hypothetical protein
MSTPDTEAKTINSHQNLSRGVFTLMLLVFAAAAGGIYFALTLK